MTRRKFLIVDDSRVSRLKVRGALTGDSHELHEASNGLAAVRMYMDSLDSGDVFHLVLMDITMDELDGVQSAERILRMHPEACIIMLSAVSDPDSIKHCINLGVKDYITKPFESESLRAAVADALGMNPA